MQNIQYALCKRLPIHFFSSKKVEKNDLLNEKIQATSIPVFCHLLCLFVSSQVTIGLAKIFDFEVLTHGTALTNYYGILKHGADPSKAKSEIGSTYMHAEGDENDPLMQHKENFFYVFKDTEANPIINVREPKQPSLEELSKDHVVIPLDGVSPLSDEYPSLSCANKLQVLIAPRLHASWSGVAHTVRMEDGAKKVCHQMFFSTFNFFLSPTIRFVYTKPEIKDIFENDPDYGGLAYRTKHPLPNERIGLIGVCKHLKINNLQNGLKNRPLRVLMGIIHLLAGTLITCIGLGIII